MKELAPNNNFSFKDYFGIDISEKKYYELTNKFVEIKPLLKGGSS